MEKSIENFIEHELTKVCPRSYISVDENYIYVKMKFFDYKKDYLREQFNNYKQGTDFENINLAFLMSCNEQRSRKMSKKITTNKEYRNKNIAEAMQTIEGIGKLMRRDDVEVYETDMTHSDEYDDPILKTFKGVKRRVECFPKEVEDNYVYKPIPKTRKIKYETSMDLVKYLTDIKASNLEKVIVFGISDDLEVMYKDEITTVSDVDCADYDLRGMYRKALIENCAGIVICHNHPSEDSLPSDTDCVWTKHAMDSCEFLGMQLFDHLIVSRYHDEYFSFYDYDFLGKTNSDSLVKKYYKNKK